MSDLTIQQLQNQLAYKDRALKLVMAVDHIRDTIQDPLGMLTEIVNLLAVDFKTDLCLLALYDDEIEDMELKAIHRKNGVSSKLGQLISRDLAQRAMNLTHITVWRTEDLMAEFDLPTDLEVAAVPIAISDSERLGAMLLARHKNSYSENEVKLLEIAEDQIDSAVIQGHAHKELNHRNMQLEIINQIDRIRDQHMALDSMLNAVLLVLQNAVPCEQGFAMLYDQNGKRLGMRAATNDDLFRMSPFTNRIDELAHHALDEGQMVCMNGLGEDKLDSFMCLPLILNDRLIGTIGVVNRFGPRGFTQRDRELLAAIGSQMDTAIYETLEKRHLREVLGRSVDPRVMERILTMDEDVLRTERMTLSVLYADMRGSTRLAENTEPDLLVGYINAYLSSMTEVVLSHEGTLDKFVGDEVMALFGAPFPQVDHALRSVQVGLAMLKVHEKTMREWKAKGVDAAPIGVGIATGELIVGEMGSTQRTDYTVIGRAANLGARICGAATAGQLLISQATYDLVKPYVQAEPVTGLQFKGVQRDTTVYWVKKARRGRIIASKL